MAPKQKMIKCSFLCTHTDVSYKPLLNYSKTYASISGASTWICVVSRPLAGDTYLFLEDEVEDAWTLEIDTSTSNELESTNGREGQALSP